MSGDELDEETKRREFWGFDSCCEDSFGVVRDAWRAYEPGPPIGADDLRPVALALAHGLVAPAFAEDVLEASDANERLASFAAELAGVFGAVSASGLYLSSAQFEHAGKTAEAESALQAATLADPSYRPALVDLAWYVGDRGDADAAVRLLRRAGVSHDDPKLSFLLERLAQRGVGVGRNDPCPCGSGRKYKACCLDSPRTSIESRTGWMCQKLVTFTMRPARRGRVQDLFEIVSETAGPRVATELVPCLIDLAAFQGGALEEFIDDRGELLPGDELALALSWLGSRQALWEVVATDPGFTVTLRDTGTGGSVVVTERSASQTLRPGVYLLTRVVAAGSQHQIVGLPLTITLRQRQSLMQLLDSDPEVEELAHWLGLAMGPPKLANREGEDLVVCRAVLHARSVSWQELTESLNARFNASSDGWTELVDIDGEDMIRSFLRREDDALVVDTNSVERFDRLLGVLQGLVAGGFEVLEEERLSPAEAAARLPVKSESAAETEEPELSPEMTQMMKDMMRKKEDAWLDEHVPALGGFTPRQAANDPTRRKDLIALLREFDGPPVQSGGPPSFSFDVARLRELLGISPDS